MVVLSFVVAGVYSHVGYMKYAVNQGRISSFVVGRAGSEYGLPVAVIYNAASKATSA